MDVQAVMVFQPVDTKQVGWDLTPKEREVLSLLGGGCNNIEITGAMHISPNTLRTHMRNIFSKLDVNDRTKAAIWAVMNSY